MDYMVATVLNGATKLSSNVCGFTLDVPFSFKVILFNKSSASYGNAENAMQIYVLNCILTQKNIHVLMHCRFQTRAYNGFSIVSVLYI